MQWTAKCKAAAQSAGQDDVRLQTVRACRYPDCCLGSIQACGTSWTTFTRTCSALYTPLLSPIRATYPAHLIILDFITRTLLGEEYRWLSSSLCSFLHSLVTSSLLGPNILLNTLFSNTLSLRSSLIVSDQASHQPTLSVDNVVK